MNRSKDIEAEWMELVPKLALSGYVLVPYRVPEGYFHGFYDRLIMVIRTESSGGLTVGTTIGAGGEESTADEMEAISPLLAGLSRKMPYQVPDNYFTRFRVSEEKAVAIVADFGSSLPLESGIGDSEKSRGNTGPVKGIPAATPVINMKPHRSWMRIAVAAAITAVILTSAFFYFRPGAVGTVANELATVSDQDMENFVATQDMPPNAGDSAAVQADVNNTEIGFSENEISDLMSNVSDNELQAYASNDGEDSNLN